MAFISILAAMKVFVPLYHWYFLTCKLATAGAQLEQHAHTCSIHQCSTLTPARRPMAENLDPGQKIIEKLMIKSALMANHIFGIKHKCETSWPGWPTAQNISVDHCTSF